MALPCRTDDALFTAESADMTDDALFTAESADMTDDALFTAESADVTVPLPDGRPAGPPIMGQSAASRLPTAGTMQG
jgi:hypothetical protein